MKRTVESKKSEMMNRKKGKELLEVYEWNNMIGELYDSICEMVNREKSHYNCKSFSVAIICCAKILKFWRLIFMSTGNTSIH